MSPLLTDLINLNLSETTDKIIAEYVWIGGSGIDLRSKARTLAGSVSDPSKLPKWNYNGSSTGQAPGEDSEVILYPQAIFRDPFRRGKNILVMCDAYTPAGELMRLPRYSVILMLLPKCHGVVLSKNTLCCRRMLSGLLDGPKEVILDLRAHITVELERTRLLDAIL